MKQVTIGELASPEPGAFKIGPFGSSLKKDELVPSGIPVAGIENVHPNRFDKSYRRYISEQKFRDLADYEIRNGDVLVTTMGTIGRAAVVSEQSTKAIFDSHLFRMRFDLSKVHPPYLCFVMNSQAVMSQLGRQSRGSIMDGLNTTALRGSVISLPDLPTQQRTAALLTRADRLRRLRRHALKMCDEILSGIFRQMFANAFTNGPFDSLADLVTITGGGTPPRDTPEYFTGSIPWFTSKDLKSTLIWDTEEHITEAAIAHSATKLVPAGSILIVVKSKVLMHRLPIAKTMVPLCHGQDIKSMQCSSRILPDFLRFALKHHEPRLLNLARGANTEGLTLPMLEELPIPKVPLPLQQKFATLATRHDRLRRQHAESLRQAEHLFQTLLHQAFQEKDPARFS